MGREDLGFLLLIDVRIDFVIDEAPQVAPQLVVFRGELHGLLLQSCRMQGPLAHDRPRWIKTCRNQRGDSSAVRSR
jgi:hypothetical protein